MPSSDSAGVRGRALQLKRSASSAKFVLCAHQLESLERRVLLSSTALVPTTTDLHNIQDGPLAKAGGNLADLYLNYRSAQRSGTMAAFDATTAAQMSQPGGSPLDVDGSTVGVELVGIGGLSKFETAMEALGLSVQSVTPADNAIAGFLPITMIRQVAQSSEVLHMTPLDKPSVYQEGEAPDQADQAMQAVEARGTHGLTGSGVTVGVISDSVSQVGNGLADSEATGDLPDDVTVIQDGQPGDTDEGRAILEELYDLAPGASLVFDTAGDSQQSMASAITALQNAGCNVIIDDIGFANEPFFQPGVIDRAIDTATADGVTYVTAAGNDGTSGFEQAASFVSADDGSGDEMINFDAGGTTATAMEITVSDAGELTLEWDDAYNGVTGTVKADLQIDLYDANGNLKYSGDDNTFQTGVPVQQIANVEPGNYEVKIEAVNTPADDLPGYYEFTGDFTMTTTQYSGLRTSIIGHAGFADAISVGAVPFYDVPPFSSSTPIPTEDYSSAGPVVEARDIDGDLMSSAITIDKPDISGTDGNNTSFFGSPGTDDPTDLPQFFGTSASAGNVAAVIVLMKQADPAATQSQILSELESTAIPVNGQAAGSYDPVGGYGLVDADAAVAALLATVPIPPPSTPSALAATAVSSSSIDISFSEASGDDLSGFVLERSTASSFKSGLVRIPLAAGTTDYTDTGLAANTAYYYRLEAYNAGGTSSFTHGVSATTPAAGTVIVDNAASSGVTIDGTWAASTAASGYYGINYLQDDDSGKGTKSVKYRPNLATAGEYDVYATWTKASNRATDVPFDVFSSTGVLLKTVRVNERSTGGDGFVLLGEFKLHSSTASFVRIRNTGTNGEVIADAIEFVPVVKGKVLRDEEYR